MPSCQKQVAIPSGAPPWVTVEDILETIQVWQRYSEEPLTSDDALAILVNVRKLLELVVRDSGHEELQEAVCCVGAGEQP